MNSFVTMSAACIFVQSTYLHLRRSAALCWFDVYVGSVVEMWRGVTGLLLGFVGVRRPVRIFKSRFKSVQEVSCFRLITTRKARFMKLMPDADGPMRV